MINEIDIALKWVEQNYEWCLEVNDPFIIKHEFMKQTNIILWTETFRVILNELKEKSKGSVS